MHFLTRLCRARYKVFLDMVWGMTILVLYFMYLNLVKGMLSIFDCSVNPDGVRFLDADLSIRCDEVAGICSTP